ncbi:MAG: response regulator [Bdellovibrionia bacterium]
MKVLIIDDDKDICETISLVLQYHGYSSAYVQSGHEGLAYLERESSQVCLVLLDLMMPGMNGWQVLKKIEENALTTSIPIFILTAFVGPIENINPNSIIRKPLDIDTLLNIVQQNCLK